MSNLGVIASRFEINSRSLKDFDRSLRELRKSVEKGPSDKLNEAIVNIIKVIKPISDNVKDNLSPSSAISDNRLISILKDRHERNWPVYKSKIISLSDRLLEGSTTLTPEDIDLLEDIADAMDAECGYLFQRLSER